MLIIDCHGHYTTAPDAHQQFRDKQLARLKDPSAAVAVAGAHQRRRDPRDDREEPAQAAARARRGHHDLLAARLGDGASRRRRGDVSRPGRARCNDLIKRVVDLYPENFVGVCQLPQSPGVPIANSIARAGALRDRARLRRLQPQSRSVGRPLDVAAAHRQALVSVLREDGRARRAGDDPRLGVVQPELPRDRRALHQRRHHGVHAVHRGRSVPRLPDAALHHPARRRRGAVSLGPLSRARGHAEAAAARAST